MKRNTKRRKTTIKINNSVVGDSIEITMERLMEGEGESGIEDRDLVYNDGESGIVNPITNIRSDKMELMLEEKIGEYDYQRKRTAKITEEKPEVEKEVKEE